MAASNASMPRRDWAGASRVVVVCRAAAENGNAATTTWLQDTLCTAVAANAANGAALPVSSARFGDPLMFDSSSLVLLVNAAARRDTDGDTGDLLVTFAIRPWRAVAGDENDLFGGAPRAVRVPASASVAELEPAVSEALDHILPWRQRGH